MPPSEAAIEALAEDFEHGFRDRLGPIRQVGLEAEFPLVTEDGRAGDLQLLWPAILEDSSFTAEYEDPQTRSLIVSARRSGTAFAAEVGRGTLELSLGPYEDLWALQAALDGALGKAVASAQRRGLQLLGFGIQPRTPARAGLMTPRRHYRALLRSAGRAWLPLTTTASSQLHVDISRREIASAVNAMNLVSGPLIAWAGNSSVYGGRAGAALSGREALLSALGEHRYGMTPRRIKDAPDWVSYLADYRFFVDRRGGKLVPLRIPFRTWLDRDGAHLSRADRLHEFLWHEHYVWNSARARLDHSTIEVRPACEQPPGSLLAIHALTLGWVESLADLEAYFSDAVGEDSWPAMIRYRREAVRDGLQAAPPAAHMLPELLEISRRALVRRGRNEEQFLDPIAARLESGENPGLQARAIFQSRGMQALVRSVRIEAN
jgi:gamma-glutamylcysteine synthetase